MAKGTTIEKLFLSLGLDMTGLDADLLTASKTVNQGMSDIRTKTQQAKLKMEIDMTQFKGAENSTEALAAKTKHLTDQLNLQRQAVSLMNAAYAESVASKGKDDAVSQRILTRLLREQRAEADLAAQIRQTNAVRTGGNVTPTVNTGTTNAASAAVGALAGSLGRVRDAGQAASNNIMTLNAKFLALTAVAASGAGLFNTVKGAVEAGDAAYKLANRLNLTTAEAGELNRILKISDVDSQAFITTMIRLDKSVSTVGKNGNTLTDAMQLFNFSLTDSAGNLLPMNQQLAQLAKGYQNAAKAGEEEAFTAEVLGAKGAALVGVLRDYTVNAEAASRVKTIGIDPKQAHELAIEMKVLSMESAQMQNALGMALMPIAKEIIPDIIDSFNLVVGAIKDNKDKITDTTTAVIDISRSVKDFGVVVGDVTVDWVKFMGHLVEIDSVKDITKAFDDLSNHIKVIAEHPVISLFEAINPFSDEDMIKPFLEQYKAEKQASEMSDRLKKVTLENNKKIAAENKKIAEDEASAVIAANKKKQDSARANAKAQQELADEVYRANHTALENELYDLNVKKDKLIADGVEETTALEITEARKKMIIDKNNKEIQKSVDEMNKEIYKLGHSALEARLYDIEVEKKAWIEKTHDEVKATQLAEQEKIKAVKESINAQLGEEVRAVKEAILAGKSKEEAYKIAYEKHLADLKAEEQSQEFVRNKNGVYLPGDTKSQVVIDGNSAYQLNEVATKLITTIDNLNPNNTNNTSNNSQNYITVNVPVNAEINSDTDVTALANKVADVIQTPLLKALGGDENSY